MDIVFTAVFGFVGRLISPYEIRIWVLISSVVDAFVFLSTITMIKKREQNERYLLIDQKHGHGGI